MDCEFPKESRAITSTEQLFLFRVFFLSSSELDPVPETQHLLLKLPLVRGYHYHWFVCLSAFSGWASL